MNEKTHDRSPAQWFCLIGGAILLVRGTVGVALDPDFGTPGEGWHQLIHLSSGVLLLAVARLADARAALVAALSFGTAYAGIAVIGIVNGQDVVGVIGVQTSDNIIHTVLALAALVSGAASLRRAAPARVEAPA